MFRSNISCHSNTTHAEDSSEHSDGAVLTKALLPKPVQPSFGYQRAKFATTYCVSREKKVLSTTINYVDDLKPLSFAFSQ